MEAIETFEMESVMGGNSGCDNFMECFGEWVGWAVKCSLTYQLLC